MSAAIQDWLRAVEEIDPTVFDTDGMWEQIYQWLAAPDPSPNYYAALGKRKPTTGAWFIQGRQFDQWWREPDSFIWLYGVPGCGKSVMASTIIEYCLQRWQNVSGQAVVYFYFDFVETEKRKHEGMIRSLITQLAFQNASNAYGSSALLSMYEACRSGVCLSTRASLLSVLRDLIDSFADVYVVLDALDECVERDDLLQDIKEIVGWKTGRLHLLVTSRREGSDIECQMRRLASDENIIEFYRGCRVTENLSSYIKEIMRTDPEWKKWEMVIKVTEEIQETLTTNADGVSQWITRKLEQLKGCGSLVEIRMTLGALPATLEDTYAEILWDIPEQHNLQVLRILQWLVYSQRPLRPEEIAEVIAADVDKDSNLSLDGPLSDLRVILSMLPNLVTTELVTNNDGRTEEHVRLAHYSVQEYLVSDRIRDGPVKQYSIQEERANTSIAETCLAYLLQFDEPSSLMPQVHEWFPLCAYAAKYWAEHVRRAGNHAKEINELMMKLFHSKQNAYVNFIRLLYSRTPWESKLGRKAIPSPLYYASLSCLTEAVKRLLEKGVDTNRQEGAQGSALHVASARGNVEIVKLLLHKGARPDQKNERGETPLALAAIYGHEKVVEILLARDDVDPNTVDEEGLTPLSQVARSGHEEVVKVLLRKHGVCVSSARHGGRTPLSWAAKEGHVGVVSILLRQRKTVDPIEKDAEHSYSAMEWAVLRGDEATIKALLKRRELVVLGQRCARPIQMAVIGGRVSILKLLLEKGFHANAEYRGRTALMRAVIKGNEEIIKLLLEAEHVNPNFQLAADGRTALMVAAENFRVGAVKLLLSDKRVDRDLRDRYGRKALTWVRNARQVLPQYGDEFDIITEMLTGGENDNVSEENEEQESARFNWSSLADYSIND